jgi:hypothetical protein
MSNRRVIGPNLPGDFPLILLLFLSARLMMLMIWPAENLTLYGDYRYYFDLASLSEAGHIPFIHYWSEHAPLFPFLNLALYQLSGGVLKNHVLLTSLAMLVFEAGSLILLYLLANDIRDKNQAVQVSWVYAVLYVPAFMWLSTFEAMTAFFVLLALFFSRRNRLWLTGLVVGLGTMTKLLPIVLLAMVWRTHGWRAALIGGLAALLVCAVVLGPLLALSPDYTLASLQAQMGKSSWQTVWALIDGNVENTGNFGPIADRFDPAKARQMLHNPPRLPSWLTLIPFALLGLFIFTRPLVRDRHDGLIFSTLTIIIFFLWSKGWSPQWQMFLIPLLLLTLPLRRAVMFVIVLGFVNLLEWPVILSRGLWELLPLTVIIRTLIFVLLVWELYRQIRGQAMPGALGYD